MTNIVKLYFNIKMKNNFKQIKAVRNDIREEYNRRKTLT